MRDHLHFLILIPLSMFFIYATGTDCFSNSWGAQDRPVLHAAPFSKLLVERQKARSDVVQMNKICKALSINKNMVILDIGTGSGQNAYKFARILGGTGKVFATDINPDMINYVKIQAEKKHLRNLVPVLVKADGVDDFYGQHRYDLIFIAHALEYIPDAGNFLRRMKENISPQGHLAILRYKFLNKFEPQYFTDVNGLLKQILKEQANSPFYKYISILQPEARRILEGAPVNRTYLSQIAGQFNEMVNDGHFFVPFLDKNKMILRDCLKIPPQEIIFINFNFSILKEFNVLDKQRGIDRKSPFLNPVNDYVMKMINQILIISEFQEFMYGGKSPFLPGGDVSYNLENVRNEFKSYGYELVQTYDFIPNEILLEFLPTTGKQP